MTVRRSANRKAAGQSTLQPPLWFDVMCRGRRWRMRVDAFALARGATESVASKQKAERVWEPKFVAEIMAGVIRAWRRRREAGVGHADRRGVPRPVLHELRRGGGIAGSRDDQGPPKGDQPGARQLAGRRAGKAEPIQRSRRRTAKDASRR